MEKPFFNENVLLEKFPGKGGWTYAAIPGISQNKNNPFGWVKIRGSIDGVQLKQYKLMPMGEGKLFLPVKAEIRKKINKCAGDYVRVILFLDNSSFEIPNDILECFKHEDPKALSYFKSLSEGEQKSLIDWVNSAKQDKTRVKRICDMMDELLKKDISK